MPPFVIFGLPRSRTAWLSAFLSYGGWFCGHDQLRYFRSVKDISGWLDQPLTGSVETAGAAFWRTLRDLRPDTRVVVIRRPVADVVASLMALNLGLEAGPLTAAMQRMDAKLSQIVRRYPGALEVTFAELGTEAGCKRVFEHCLSRPHDPDWWAFMAPRNIQVNVAACLRYFAAHHGQLAKLGAQLKSTTLAKFSHRSRRDLDGLAIAEEPLKTLMRDAKGLIESHATVVEDAPEDAWTKNYDLMFKMEELGSLQVLVARSNGRVFGYLLTVIGPSMEANDRTTATHTAFYASPDFPGVGRKLKLAAHDILRDKGVHEVMLRAGVRGDGPRLGSLYRRLGAVDHGQLFKIELQE
jgi:hypothetical protein